MTQNSRNLVIFTIGTLVFSALGHNLYFEPTQVWAQDQKTRETLQHIEELGKATGSYHAEMTITINRDGKSDVTQGHFKFKWPNMRWLESRRQEDGMLMSVMTYNENVRWNYIPSRQFAFKYNIESIEADAQGKGWISANNLDGSTLKYVKQSVLGTEPVYVIEGQPSPLLKEKTPKKLGKIQLYFSVNDGILRKLITYDSDGRVVNSQIQTNIRKDSTISDEDFEFIPPEGTRIYEINTVGPGKKSTD